ncbi:hypothetical protein FPOA_11852 [Fusarium poae]|uniref:C2H2-type domain-containing protein n=1 Tax=Fusarium poae TaxID=36050 RepID=A0A1B8AI19_FUSPO|nr:hypothetical protein FPOA_11852 [Fusarium poae]
MLDEFGAPIFSPEEVEHLKRLEQQHPSNARRMAVDRLREPSPEPARVVSDISDGALKTSAARLSSLLASNPKIKAAQSEWEKKNQSQSQPGPSYAGPLRMPSLKPPQPHRKRDSPASDGSAGPATKRQNSDFDFEHARQEAFRFTEAEVARQMSEINNTPSIPAQMVPQSQTHSQTTHLTGAELVKKYTGQGTSPTPVPTPGRRTPAAMGVVADYQHTGEVVPITIAEGNRLYSSYHDPKEGVISARGALIPPNYKLYDDDPLLPFVCPVRDCRRLFKGLPSLGGHFSAGHCLTTFNDNGDGTLTKVGSYKKNGPGPTPAIVVSRHPLPPNAPPPVNPGLSVAATFQQGRAFREQLTKKTTRGQETPVFPPTPLVRSSDVKSFLHKHLSPDQTEHHREDIDFMLSLPRMRDLTKDWKQSHGGKTLDMSHYACALAYLTGRVVDGIEKCRANLGRPTSRLSTPCIALPFGMPTAAKQAFSSLETCVGCRYWCILQRRSNACDWCPASQRRQQGSSASSARSSSSEDVTPAMDVDAEEEPEVPIIMAPVTETTTQPATGIPSRPDQVGGVELEMEDWEIAPGRMKDSSSSDNVAFSNSYLTSGQPVTVSEDVSFNVIVLKPGSSSHWKVEDAKLRTCSVAAGKVVVTIGDQEQTFNLGPNGVFIVRPGQACKVTNRLYLDSVLHCTTINDFALQ